MRREPLIRRRRRALTADEEDLWSVVVRSVRPLRSPARKAARAAAESVAVRTPATPPGNNVGDNIATAADAIAGKKVGKNVDKKAGAARKPVPRPAAAEARIPARPPRPPGPPALQPIMRREIKKLARGGETIDARIDLHGMTQSEAHAALQSLLLRCQADGAKFVLVITGKGRSDDRSEDRGVLRRQVPVWLGLPEFRRFVAGYEVAHAGHGGDGALYVRLRKPRAAR